VADIVKRLPISRRKVLLVTCAAQDLTAVTSLPGASVQVFLGGPGEIGDFSRGLREEKITLKKCGFHQRAHLNRVGFEGLTADVLWIHTHGSKAVFDDYLLVLNEEGYVVFGALDSAESAGGAAEVEKRFAEKTYPGFYFKVDSHREIAAFCKMKVPRDIRFAVITMTYRRKDGSSKEKLEKMMRCINGQSYKNFRLFLMGDDYEDEAELREIGARLETLPGGEVGPDLYFENVKPALERSLCKKKYNLWAVGGAGTLNEGLRRARQQGFSYYAHIDDDDFWHPHHLLTLATTYYMYPETTASWTLGVLGGWVLPPSWPIRPNNFLPKGKDCFHSTLSFRLDKINLEYITISPDMKEEEEPDMEPADSVLASSIGNLVMCGLAVVTSPPVVTCYRLDEGSKLRE